MTVTKAIGYLKSIKVVKARFHYERGKDYSLFVLLIFLLCSALASILSAERSIKETKNALFHARSGNGPLCLLTSECAKNKITAENKFRIFFKTASWGFK